MEYELMYGDCMEMLDRVPDASVDLVLTDPPYGISYQSCRGKYKKKPKIINDSKPFTEFVAKLPMKLKSTGAALIFTRWDVQQAFIDALTNAGIRCKSILIWDKCYGGTGDLKRAYSRSYESILFAPMSEFAFPNGRPMDIIREKKIPAQKLIHPCQKPIPLLETLLSQTCARGGTVIDPFMGSGSTGVACGNLGYEFIGMELDAGYFDVAKKRIDAAYAQTRMALEA